MFLNSFIAAHLILFQGVESLDQVNQLETTTNETTRIYLVRHGESAYNIPGPDGIQLTSGKGISTPLTENGKMQAKALGRKLLNKLSAKENYVLLSSTALRAQHTADLIFDEINSHYSMEQGKSYENLCELGQGKWEGKPKDTEYNHAMKFWEDLSAKDKFVFPKIATGESYQEVAARFLAALQDIVDANGDKTIFITTHYAAINALALQLNKNINQLSEEPSTPLPTIKLNNCDIILLELEKGHSVNEALVKIHIKSEV